MNSASDAINCKRESLLEIEVNFHPNFSISLIYSIILQLYN